MTVIVNNASKSLVNIIKEIVKLDGASIDIKDDYPTKLISSRLKFRFLRKYKHNPYADGYKKNFIHRFALRTFYRRRPHD